MRSYRKSSNIDTQKMNINDAGLEQVETVRSRLIFGYFFILGQYCVCLCPNNLFKFV